jgi:hypothetical protein
LPFVRVTPAAVGKLISVLVDKGQIGGKTNGCKMSLVDLVQQEVPFALSASVSEPFASVSEPFPEPDDDQWHVKLLEWIEANKFPADRFKSSHPKTKEDLVGLL